MKRSDMLLKLMEMMVEAPEDIEAAANDILTRLEKAGMTPPRVSEENVQAILSVYYAGYTTHQWDEDLEKDEKVMEAKRKRAEIAALTPEERSARLRASAARRTRR